MKWCFLVNNVDYLMEFSGRLCQEALQRGDECLVIFNSKVTEYSKKKYFPEGVRLISKVDWLAKNYNPLKKEALGVAWKDFFATFERKSKYLNLNYENSAEIILQSYQFFTFLFDQEKPDMVVNESPANIFTIMAYNFCQTYGKNYIGFIDSRIRNRVDIFDRVHTCSLYQRAFKELKFENISDQDKQFAMSFIDDFLSHKQLPSNIVYQLNIMQDFALIRYIKREIKTLPFWMWYLLNRRKIGRFDYETETKFWYTLRYPFGALVCKAKKFIFKYTFHFINGQDSFFLFPLQFYPEASMSMWAPYYSDQLNVIKNIAFSLPFGYKLYVKEHPMAQGTRALNFYKKIKKIPNVVLISPYENNPALIKKSKGVVTITSTLGLEAALMNKAVYLLGDVFYEYHPACIKIQNYQDLSEKIKKGLEKNKPMVNQKENVRFILSYFQNTILGHLYCDYQKNDPNDYPTIYNNIIESFLTNTAGSDKSTKT